MGGYFAFHYFLSYKYFYTYLLRINIFDELSRFKIRFIIMMISFSISYLSLIIITNLTFLLDEIVWSSKLILILFRLIDVFYVKCILFI